MPKFVCLAVSLLLIPFVTRAAPKPPPIATEYRLLENDGFCGGRLVDGLALEEFGSKAGHRCAIAWQNGRTDWHHTIQVIDVAVPPDDVSRRPRRVPLYIGRDDRFWHFGTGMEAGAAYKAVRVFVHLGDTTYWIAEGADGGNFRLSVFGGRWQIEPVDGPVQLFQNRPLFVAGSAGSFTAWWGASRMGPLPRVENLEPRQGIVYAVLSGGKTQPFLPGQD